MGKWNSEKALNFESSSKQPHKIWVRPTLSTQSTIAGHAGDVGQLRPQADRRSGLTMIRLLIPINALPSRSAKKVDGCYHKIIIASSFLFCLWIPHQNDEVER
jgi:hypothetical protein